MNVTNNVLVAGRTSPRPVRLLKVKKSSSPHVDSNPFVMEKVGSKNGLGDVSQDKGLLKLTRIPAEQKGNDPFPVRGDGTPIGSGQK